MSKRLIIYLRNIFYTIAKKCIEILNRFLLLFIKGDNLKRYVRFCSDIEVLQKIKSICYLQQNYYLKDNDYLFILTKFHDKWYSIKHNYHYLEIGTYTFNSFLISRGKLNVGVDPQPSAAIKFNDAINREYRLNVTTSDCFFKFYSDSNVFYDLIFIDGLHVFEQAAKDLVNALLKTSHNSTDILVHDAIPINKFIANPQRKTNYWTGNVYKLIYFLKLIGVNFKVFLSPPSGLLWVKGKQRTKVEKYRDFPDDIQALIDNVNSSYKLSEYEINNFIELISNLVIDSQSL